MWNTIGPGVHSMLRGISISVVDRPPDILGRELEEEWEYSDTNHADMAAMEDPSLARDWRCQGTRNCYP